MTRDVDPITLHAALDAYAEQIGNKGGLSASASLEKRRSIVRRLKRHHEDIPLFQLDLDQCVAMIDLWKSRPISARTGKPMAASTARTTLSELIRFFGWLDTTERCAWKAPTYFGQISRGVRKPPSD